MKINVNHPSFIAFLESINSTILSSVKVEKYFGFGPDKKLSVQYLVLKMILQTVKVRAKLTEKELLEFSELLRKKNEDIENYEFAAVLKDIVNNFDVVYDMIGTPRRQQPKTIRTDKSTDQSES